MRAFRSFVLATVAAAGVLLAPGRAAAHALHADVTVGAEIKVLAYFDDDTPAEFAEVVVTDADGAEVVKGKTDERGLWTFPKPKPGAYVLVAKSVGHTAQVKFAVPAPRAAEPGGDGETRTAPPGARAAPPEEPVTYTEPRANVPRNLAIGGGGLLALSGLYWLARRKRWVE
jgi:hypothetical protein